ncbi:hypothetical protein NPIL_483691 [Nephila pilipes]|uniref:Uncharacterized protein n=1 Tax=Nephila pilipes TaxID=299642 RepID=A0A8X6UNE4_NEPPI|nr:hypothetical protein NPIL_483691 [Nephila pilipes]
MLCQNPDMCSKNLTKGSLNSVHSSFNHCQKQKIKISKRISTQRISFPVPSSPSWAMNKQSVVTQSSRSARGHVDPLIPKTATSDPSRFTCQ